MSQHDSDPEEVAVEEATPSNDEEEQEQPPSEADESSPKTSEKSDEDPPQQVSEDSDIESSQPTTKRTVEIDDDEDDESEEEIVIHRKKKVKRKRDDDEASSEDDMDNEDQESNDSDDVDDEEEDKVTKKVDDDEDEEEEDDETSKHSDKEDEEDDNKVVSDQQEDEEDDDEDESKDRRESARNTTLYDFDIMMAKKKEENSKKRRRRNYDIINDNDDIIADIINQMKDAVEADSEANKKKMAATKKLKLLPYVINQLRKVDLRDAFLDSDVLSVITEWLAPLPDRSLPHLNIRENLLKILIDFNLYDVDRIKASGIGKAIMYLYKHPKETRENKQRAKQLISCWSRPIFQLDSSFTSISKEEREQRDLELMKKQRRASRQDSPDGERAGPSSGGKTKEQGAQKPGDKGWIPRARVPAPSMRDYVIRPQSKVDGDVGKNSRRPSNMLEKYMKSQQERKRANRQQRAINMKIDRG